MGGWEPGMPAAWDDVHPSLDAGLPDFTRSQSNEVRISFEPGRICDLLPESEYTYASIDAIIQ